ncbi:TonB-dependent receptor [Terriglobus roseus]|uniref:Carboxypeptidase regulatory-like domain-containing protein n=1 Tax=Terriglobus roseus TaxID=392734 RepID=A0A1H4N7J9_9BACT|nr:TonB-dependent receptor [Terriglobus roseus]SEB91306.1 Carboxypeptidase regulatory-like domain-containing protein [Terriglobus roseus]
MTFFSRPQRLSLAATAVLIGSAVAGAQTFRGTISGNITDSSGAIVSDAVLTLSNPATGSSISGKSNKAGDYQFPELTPGIYSLTVSAPGFATRKMDKIEVQVTKVVTLDVALNVGAESTVIEVTTSPVQTDTQSSALVAVIDSKAVQEMPMNGRDFTRMTKFAPGVSALSNSVNGSRTTAINFQVDGTDNVDAWLGIVASNQGGIASVPGGLIPIEAIDQFSMQAAGEADQGRNAGANSNMVLRSGTNNIHGDVFYFDRNEFFAALNPFQAPGSRKQLIRNHQGGFTLGGPIWRDHTFLFLAGEIQVAKANTSGSDTVLTDAWISQGRQFLAAFGQTPSPLSLNLYNLLYPANTKGLPATVNNYLASAPANYNSFNGIIKLDHTFTDKHKLSLRYLGTTGKQTAPTASLYADYFQTAPMHIHNASVIDTYTINSRMLNQVTLGMNYFLQTFNDANQGFNPQTNAGLNLGITNPIVAQGAPSIIFTGGGTGSGFDQVGATQPSGRTDVTGDISDSFHWTVGKHSLKLGGEYRRGNVNQLYFSSARGTFTFDGQRGSAAALGWSTGAQAPSAKATATCTALGVVDCGRMTEIADFLYGAPTNTGSSGARLLQGNAQRVWTINTEDFWISDNFQASKKLNVSFGLRYTLPGVVNAEKNDVYNFVPGTTPSFQLGTYNNYKKAIAPRVGFSYSPLANDTTVLRGSFGIFYDVPGMVSMVSGSTGNGGANYLQNNPAGPDAAVIYNATNVRWATGVNPFVGANAPQLGIAGVNKDIGMEYGEVYSLGVEQQLSNKTLATISYVGSSGRHLLTLFDLNQPLANGTATQSSSPYTQTVLPNQSILTGQQFLGINQLNSSGSSNYNSLQASIRQSVWKGVNFNVNYTWSKSLDDVSSPTTPMNSYNIHQDYGPSTFDNRNTVTGTVFYDVPQLGHFAPKLTKGWQANALFTYSSGQPINPLSSGDRSLTRQLKDRPNVVSTRGLYVGGTNLLATTATSRTYRFLNANTTNQFFAASALGTYGNLRRDAIVGPNFRTVDVSIFKHTRISEKINTELRAELFNVFNFNNFANPTITGIGPTTTSASWGQTTATRNNSAAPGIGFGEPFNIQFAFKVSF